jgi:putative hemolysin
MPLKNQKGISTFILVVILFITASLAFIAFKLYIEPSKIQPEKIKPGELQVSPNDSFSQKNSETQTPQLANPASENCAQKGGILKIMETGSGAQFGLCQFDDDRACEEWALMRGECPVGGVKTTGFDNTQQAYCAWLGGQTEAVENAQCELPSGKACPVDSLWEGTCP